MERIVQAGRRADLLGASRLCPVAQCACRLLGPQALSLCSCLWDLDMEQAWQVVPSIWRHLRWLRAEPYDVLALAELGAYGGMARLATLCLAEVPAAATTFQ